MNLTEQVKAYALSRDADLVGVASIDRFDGAPPGHHPCHFMPDAKSVISIATHIPDAICDVAAKHITIQPYQIYGYAWMARFDAMIGFLVARFLEKRGYQALPIVPRGANWYTGDGMGDISHRHAAVAAGIAVFGWSNLALTPQYGARQRFVSVVTDAPLEPDPVLDCDVCTKCMLCVKHCPTGAISADKIVSFNLAGKRIQYAVLDRMKCSTACRGLTTKAWGLKDVELPANATAEDWWKAEWDFRAYPQRNYELAEGGIPFCGQCLTRCPASTGIRALPR